MAKRLSKLQIFADNDDHVLDWRVGRQSRLLGPNDGPLGVAAAACAKPVWAPTRARIVAVTTERVQSRLAMFEICIVNSQ